MNDRLWLARQLQKRAFQIKDPSSVANILSLLYAIKGSSSVSSTTCLVCELSKINKLPECLFPYSVLEEERYSSCPIRSVYIES